MHSATHTQDAIHCDNEKQKQKKSEITTGTMHRTCEMKNSFFFVLLFLFRSLVVRCSFYLSRALLYVKNNFSSFFFLFKCALWSHHSHRHRFTGVDGKTPAEGKFYLCFLLQFFPTSLTSTSGRVFFPRETAFNIECIKSRSRKTIFAFILHFTFSSCSSSTVQNAFTKRKANFSSF